MNDPDVYAVEFAENRVNAIPWYFPIFQAADRCNCAPWELIDKPTPRAFWYEAGLVVAAAESAHAKFLRERANNSTTGPGDPTKGPLG